MSKGGGFEVSVGHDCTVDGQYVSVEFTRSTQWSRDRYGEDADGNRGMNIVTIDSDEAHGIEVYCYDGPNKGKTLPLSDFAPAFQEGIRNAVDAYLQANEPEAPEEREPDYDDIREREEEFI